MPSGFCWFWWLAPSYWHPYSQRFWRIYPWFLRAHARRIGENPREWSINSKTYIDIMYSASI